MTQLIRYDEARRALQLARTVDEAKDIKDKAEALRSYAQQRGDIEMERWVAEIKIRAILRIGELSADLDKAQTQGKNGTVRLPASGKSKAAALRAAGISTSVANRAECLAEHSAEVEAYISKKAEQRKPVKYTEVLAAVESGAREQRNKSRLRREAHANLPPGLHLGDFRKKAKALADECAELVFTDPPYDRDSIPLFGDAAKEAARILKPGGSFLAYCGQTQLPEALILCAKHLRYWWCGATLDEGSEQRMTKYGVICQWKPLLWFVKGTRGDVSTFIKDVIGGPKAKGHHDWQQAEEEAVHWIQALTSPAGLVVDFFVGGGTTLVAAKSLGRPAVGFEIDPTAALRAGERLSKAA